MKPTSPYQHHTGHRRVHGLRKGISVENPLLRLTESVFKSMKQKMNVGGIFCALAKAFFVCAVFLCHF
jgi:hypothetical protein